VIIEEGPESWGAYVPGLPGCIAVAESRIEVEELIRDAIVFHVEGLRAGGEPVPAPVSSVTMVEVPAA
jgi:predicted RNase H-like HicB family nuclease